MRTDYGPNTTQWECKTCGRKWWDSTPQSGAAPEKCDKCNGTDLKLADYPNPNGE